MPLLQCAAQACSAVFVLLLLVSSDVVAAVGAASPPPPAQPLLALPGGVAQAVWDGLN